MLEGVGGESSTKEEAEKGDDEEAKGEVEAVATAAPAGSIKAIDRGVVHQICSGQVVLTLATAVKELLENSMDAGATSVDLRLEEHGAALVEVSDNGSGVAEADLPGLTLKHHTSKLRDFSDLAAVETFGFRGEALSSLCALADMTITTRSAAAAAGTAMTYDHGGAEVTRATVARGVGTTVTMRGLFATMPVRHREFLRNIKKEFSRLVAVVSGYALVSAGVRLTCSNTPAKGRRSVVVQTLGRGVKENLVAVFGAKQAATLVPFVQTQGAEVARVEGWVSSARHGEGRGAPDRQFYYVNSRPCDPARLARAVNQAYHAFNRHQFPFVYLDVHTERSTVDVNLTPDKRQVLLAREKALVEAVVASLEAMWADTPATMQLHKPVAREPGLQAASRPDLQGFQSSRPNLAGLQGTKRPLQEGGRQGDGRQGLEKRQRTLAGFVQRLSGNGDTGGVEEKAGEEVVKEVATKVGDEKEEEADELQEEDENKENVVFKEEEPAVVKVDQEELPEDDSFEHVKADKEEQSSKHHVFNAEETLHKGDSVAGFKLIFEEPSRTHVDNSNDHSRSKTVEMEGVKISFETPPSSLELSCDSPGKTSTPPSRFLSEGVSISFDTFPSSSHPKAEMIDCKPSKEDSNTSSNEGSTAAEDPVMKVPAGRKTRGKAVTVQFSLEKVREAVRRKTAEEQEEKSLALKFKARIEPGENKSAEEELSKQIKKTDFVRMKIFGQFNLGFLIVGLDTDLFIVDQHATDEKYNFERLQAVTHLKPQKMVVAQRLELTAGDEAVLLDNLAVFEKNGFQFEVDEAAAAGRRVRLAALPHHRNWVFGKEDIEELVFMLAEGGEAVAGALRPSRVRAMFASRACRTSVMVGTALSRADMRRLVDHMGELEQPWNCPHGRPTLRHLVNTAMIQ